MKNKYFICITIGLIIIFTPVLFGQTLDENLKLLEPLTNKVWQSEMQGLRDENTIVSRREWKVTWNGKAIKYTSTTEKLNVQTEGFFFWDPVKKEISLFTLNNQGRVMQGYVKENDGKILMYGHITLEDKKLEFRNSFELTEDGKILDQWHRFEDDRWKAGHSVELYELKNPADLH